MIATADLQDILEETELLNEKILQCREVRHYRFCKAVLEQDQQAQQLIARFIRKKEDFEEAERFGKYHPDYERFKREMREVKRALDMHESVAAFKKAEKAVDVMLAEISKTIAYAVSTSIKVPTGNPFFDEAMQGGCGSGGCSGGCSSCGN